MIEYTVVKRSVTKNNTKVDQYYPKIVRGSTMQTDELATLLQQRTTLSEGEVYAFLDLVAQALGYFLCNSYPVQIEGLGIFTPAIVAESVATADEVTAKTIVKKTVRYRPTTQMKAAFKAITYAKANLGTSSDSSTSSGDSGSSSSSGTTTGGGSGSSGGSMDD